VGYLLAGIVIGPATPGFVALVQAHIVDARMLVIATPQTVEVRQMIATARSLNPTVDVIVRSHNTEEAALLEREHASKVFVGESELARAMTAHVLSHVTGAAGPAP
jgi:CPA2 family monovalent cation:H+ antiporter-2